MPRLKPEPREGGNIGEMTMQVIIAGRCEKKLDEFGIRSSVEKLIERVETNRTLRPFFEPHLPCWTARV